MSGFGNHVFTILKTLSFTLHELDYFLSVSNHPLESTLLVFIFLFWEIEINLDLKIHVKT